MRKYLRRSFRWSRKTLALANPRMSKKASCFFKEDLLKEMLEWNLKEESNVLSNSYKGIIFHSWNQPFRFFTYFIRQHFWELHTHISYRDFYVLYWDWEGRLNCLCIFNCLGWEWFYQSLKNDFSDSWNFKDNYSSFKSEISKLPVLTHFAR